MRLVAYMSRRPIDHSSIQHSRLLTFFVDDGDVVAGYDR